MTNYTLSESDIAKMEAFIASGGSIGGIKGHFCYYGTLSDISSAEAIAAWHEAREKYFEVIESAYMHMAYEYFESATMS